MEAGTNGIVPPRRLGLALSGGGFRAALFHIGVLAHLAELNLLREVQVLSTVSGGSIVGALYYLHLRRLLESTPDHEITPRHYLDIVAGIAREFPRAIAANLRMRAFADLRRNWRMFHDPRYSRSDRMAELYEEYLYAPVVPAGPSGRIELPALHIQPHGSREPFHPFRAQSDGRTGNDARTHKVPALVINATTLNTGHLFQFTASWMGEPPSEASGSHADGNLRLRRGYYRELPDKYRTLPLSIAVAASAAVPGIFPPLALTDLYTDAGAPFTPQLVDGGVHDNQGIAALFDPEHRCTHIIVSDASGQMDDLATPSTFPGTVMQRSNAILMDRVREVQLAVASLCQDRQPERLALLHLKQGLPQRELTWIGGREPALAPPAAATVAPQQVPVTQRTAHGVHPRVQEYLASVRTDLDAFTEVECHALMADGYLIATDRLPSLAAEWGRAARRLDWAFLRIAPLLATPDGEPRLAEHLTVAARRTGKTVRLVPWMRWMASPWTARAGATLVLAVLAFAVAASGPRAAAAVAGAAVIALLALAGLALLRFWAETRRHGRLEGMLRWLLALCPGLVVAPAFTVLARRHLAVLTALRCEQGEVCRITGAHTACRDGDASGDAATPPLGFAG